MPRASWKRRRVHRLRTREAKLKVPRMRDRLNLLLMGVGIRRKPTQVRVQSITLTNRKVTSGKARRKS
jgi:hypothetical protein